MTEFVITEIFYEEDVNIYICSWNKIEIRFFLLQTYFSFYSVTRIKINCFYYKKRKKRNSYFKTVNRFIPFTKWIAVNLMEIL